MIEQQHGFRTERFTETNLIIYTNELFNSLENDEQVDVIYTDFSKAFDRVDIDNLLFKIAQIGINGIPLKWFESCLRNRNQVIKYKNFKSFVISVTSGIINYFS